MFIYGGEDIKEGKYNDLQMLNLENFIMHEGADLEDHEIDEAEKDQRFCWQKIDQKGDAPGHLSHHKACIYAQCMYVFGGVNNKGENNNHMYQLDMNSYKWIKKDTQGHPPAGRDDFGMCIDGDNLYVFGGFVSGVRHNDLYCYSFTSNKWENLFANHPYHELEESKDFPVPRSGLAMGAHGPSIIVFGGRNDFNDMLEDTWEFNISTRTWGKIVGDNHPVG